MRMLITEATTQSLSRTNSKWLNCETIIAKCLNELQTLENLTWPKDHFFSKVYLDCSITIDHIINTILHYCNEKVVQFLLLNHEALSKRPFVFLYRHNLPNFLPISSILARCLCLLSYGKVHFSICPRPKCHSSYTCILCLTISCNFTKKDRSSTVWPFNFMIQNRFSWWCCATSYFHTTFIFSLAYTNYLKLHYSSRLGQN